MSQTSLMGQPASDSNREFRHRIIELPDKARAPGIPSIGRLQRLALHQSVAVGQGPWACRIWVMSVALVTISRKKWPET